LDTAIDRIDLFLLTCTLPETIGNASRFFRNRDALMVRVKTKGGLVGWGETWAMSGPAAALIEKTFAPALIGEDVRYPQKIWRKLSRFIVNDRRGLTHMALSALDLAVWDASSRAADQSLADRLGGALRDRVTAYVSGPFVKPGDKPYGHYLDEVGGYLAQGYRWVKLRAGVGSKVDADLVHDVRKLIGPDVGLMVDFNEAADVAQTQDFARRTVDADLIWVEEPILHDDLPGWKRLTESVPIAFAGGESLYGLAGFRDFFTAGALAVAQPDLALCGGLTEGLRIAAMAEAFNVPIAPHVWGTAINFHASLHFAAILPDRSRGASRFPFFEMDASFNPLRSEFTDSALQPDGTMAVPQGSGLGITITERQLSPFLVTHKQLDARS
jgi:D-galactarolactone cycloisomerase